MINARNPQPLSMDYASRLVEEGRRMMDHFQAFDQSSVDKNSATGEVQVDVKTPIGINHSCAKFSGDRYEGTLEVNNDERQTYLDRKYEFRDSDGIVTIKQQLPSYGEERYDLYRIDERHYSATVEHVWNHVH